MTTRRDAATESRGGGKASRPSPRKPAAAGLPAARRRETGDERKATEMLDRLRIQGDALDLRVKALLGRLGLSG